MDGRTALVTAAMDTFRWSAGEGVCVWGGECRYENWNTTTKTGV